MEAASDGRPMPASFGAVSPHARPSLSSLGAASLTPFTVGPMASFDWPPPPSPGQRTRRCMSVPATADAKAEAGLAATLGSSRHHSRTAGTRGSQHALGALQAQARAEIWEARAVIEREKIRHVPPHPYMGRPMRFQDEYSALQLTGDGCFSYSMLESVSNGPNTGATRHVTTYEGVCVAFDTENDATGLAGSTLKEPHAVEGRALLRHEAIESEGSSSVTAVVRDVFRFVIAVSPFTSASDEPMATVQASSPSITCASRCRRLPYVGRGQGGSGDEPGRIEKPFRGRGSRLRFCPIKAQEEQALGRTAPPQLAQTWGVPGSAPRRRRSVHTLFPCGRAPAEA